ncbi:MAG: sigma-70 family RNA polymerase sigma factor, partial [Armatimonadota bacterium]
ERREGDTGWCSYLKDRVSGADRHIPVEYEDRTPPGVSALEWQERASAIGNWSWSIWPGHEDYNDLPARSRHSLEPSYRRGLYFCWVPAVDEHRDAVAEANALARSMKGDLSARRRAAMGCVLYVLKHYRELEQRAKGTDREAEQLRRNLSQLDGIVRQLPPDLQEVVSLRHKDGLTQKEAAERLGVNQSTVSRRVDKAIGLIADRSEEPYLLVSYGEEGTASYVNVTPQEYVSMARAGREFIISMLAGAEVFQKRYGAVAGVFHQELRRQLRSGERAEEFSSELLEDVAAEWHAIMCAKNPAAYCIAVIRQRAVEAGKRWMAEREARESEQELDEDAIAEEEP